MLEAADIVEILSSRIEELTGLGYSDQQQTWLEVRLDRVEGVRRQVIWTHWQEVILELLNPGKPEPSPFLLGVLFSLVDERLKTLTAVLNFGVLKRNQTPQSLLNFILEFQSR